MLPLEREPVSIFGGRLRARSPLESFPGRGDAAAARASTSVSSSPPAPPEARADDAPREAPLLGRLGPAADGRGAAEERAPASGVAPAGSMRVARPAAALEAVDERLIEILDAPLAMGETAASGFLRKEQAIVAVLATLTVLESRALLARIRTARAGDRLVEKLGRLTAERRGRLLAFLADARRREALQLARTRR
jgi:hypothetical protein